MLQFEFDSVKSINISCEANQITRNLADRSNYVEITKIDTNSEILDDRTVLNDHQYIKNTNIKKMVL